MVKFCGDALLCQFRCKNKDDEIQLDAHISATKCALKMQEAFSSKLEKEYVKRTIVLSILFSEMFRMDSAIFNAFDIL